LARLFLGLAVVGFVVPNTVTLIESVQTGNILFWTDPSRTMSELFVNRTSTAFALDLLATAVAVLIWMTIEAARLGIRDSLIQLRGGSTSKGLAIGLVAGVVVILFGALVYLSRTVHSRRHNTGSAGEHYTPSHPRGGFG
jgi:hypothetical protein